MTESVSSIIKHYVAPGLRDAGFKKSGATWNHRLDGVVHVVDLQSTAKGQDCFEFTLNFGVWLEDVWRLCWAKDCPRIIHEEDCFPRFRVGQALEGFQKRTRDRWWRVALGSDAAKVGGEMHHALFQTCLPILEQLRNKSDALVFARDNVPIRLPLEALYFAILRFLNGEEEQGKVTLLELSSDAHWGSRAAGILERLRDAY
jgi:hypothetical protein